MKHCFWRSLATAALILVLLVSFVACGSDGYREVKSKRAWRKTMLTIDGEDVSFELLRFFFFRHTSEVDGGDATLWEGAEADAMTQKALKLAVEDICDLYAVFDVCRGWGIDPNGDAIDNLVNDYVTCDVDGGSPDGETWVTGFGGDYDKYLSSLEEMHLTDTVNRLLYRYAACLKTLYQYVVENGAEGNATAAEDDLRSFLNSENCAHANYAYLDKSHFPDALAQAETLYERMKSAEGNLTRLAELVTPYHLVGDPKNGEYYGKYAADTTDASRYDIIFSLLPGEVSNLIETEDGYYIYYGMKKDASLEEIKNLYLEEVYIYRRIAGKTAVFKTKVAYESAYGKLTYALLSEEA